MSTELPTEEPWLFGKFDRPLESRIEVDLMFENRKTCCLQCICLKIGWWTRDLVNEVPAAEILISRLFVVRPTTDHAAEPQRDMRSIYSAMISATRR